MGFRIIVTGIAAIFVTACVSHDRTSDAPALILQDINIIDVENDAILPGRSILIVDGRIMDIAASPSAWWPVAAQRPDVAGNYVVPSLIDAHVHIYDERDLQMYATYGIALVRSLDGWDWHKRLRAEAASHSKATAALVTSGAQFQASDFSSSETLRNALADEAERGFDWVKLYDDMDDASLGVVRASKAALSLRVTGHLSDDASISQLLSDGPFDDVAHAEELIAAMRAEFSDWRLGIEDVALAMRKSNTALTTTIVNNKMIAEQLSDFEKNLSRLDVRYASPILQVFWASEFNPYRNMNHSMGDAPPSREPLELMELTRALHDRGVRIIAGTDAPNPTTIPGASLHEELSLLVKAGLTPADALKSATSIAAEHLSPGDGRGVIRIGAPADLLLTSDNPLSDISELVRFSGLVRNGQFTRAPAVLIEREALAKLYEIDRKFLQHFSPQSAQQVIDAISAPHAASLISREGLTSLIWVYMKFENLPEARRLSDLQIKLYPQDPEAIFVSNFIAAR